jgi:hypothetical protein
MPNWRCSPAGQWWATSRSDGYDKPVRLVEVALLVDFAAGAASWGEGL